MQIEAGYSQNALTLFNQLRKLWEQHVMWTRSFIISTAAELKDLDLVTKRLLQNPGDFADLWKRFYGKSPADEFKALLEAHLLIAAQLVHAAQAGKASDIAMYEKKWYENADDIARFLSRINPYWEEKAWKKMLYDHLKMTESEAVERLNGQYVKDIKLYDAIESEALQMADMMARGIIQQFKLA